MYIILCTTLVVYYVEHVVLYSSTRILMLWTILIIFTQDDGCIMNELNSIIVMTFNVLHHLRLTCLFVQTLCPESPFVASFPSPDTYYTTRSSTVHLKFILCLPRPCRPIPPNPMQVTMIDDASLPPVNANAPSLGFYLLESL